MAKAVYKPALGCQICGETAGIFEELTKSERRELALHIVDGEYNDSAIVRNLRKLADEITYANRDKAFRSIASDIVDGNLS